MRVVRLVCVLALLLLLLLLVAGCGGGGGGGGKGEDEPSRWGTMTWGDDDWNAEPSVTTQGEAQ